MDAPFFHELRRQASSYLTGKIRSARLALTDVTPTQLYVDGGGDERGRVAAQRQDDEPHRAGGLPDRRVPQDFRHPPQQAGDVRQEAVARAVQGAAAPGAPPDARTTQRRPGVPEGRGRHPADGHLPAHRRERFQLGRDGEEQVGARAEAAGAGPVPGGGARACAQGGARDQGLRQLQPKQKRRQRRRRITVGRRRRGAAAVRAQPLAVRGPAVEGGGRRGRERGKGEPGVPTRVEGGGAGGGAVPPPPVPRLRGAAAAAAGGDAAAQPVIGTYLELERDKRRRLPPVLYCTVVCRCQCDLKKKSVCRVSGLLTLRCLAFSSSFSCCACTVSLFGPVP